MDDNTYTISEVSSMLDIPTSTIRYYDSRGLLAPLRRTSGGARVFTDDDIEWLGFIEKLKASNMSLNEIKEYLSLSAQGDATIEERRKIVYERKKAIERQLKQLQLAHDYITYKCWFYDKASEAGTCDVPSNMPPEEMPPTIRAIKERCISGK